MTPTEAAEILNRYAYAKPLDVQEAMLMAMNLLRLVGAAVSLDDDEVGRILVGTSTLSVHEREELLSAEVLRLHGLGEIGEVSMGGCDQG